MMIVMLIVIWVGVDIGRYVPTKNMFIYLVFSIFSIIIVLLDGILCNSRLWMV